MAAVRWGVLGTGSIAATLAAAVSGTFVAAASRDPGRAAAFGKEHGIARTYGQYEQLLTDDEVDAVYLALPNALHPSWTIRALEAGKHVLCEKPFAQSRADALRCVAAAEKAGKVCAEGFMWRLHPQTVLARRLVADGAIGRIAHVRAALRITSPPGDVRRSPDLGGGALSDLGCYCLSAIRLFAGEPRRITAEAVFDGVDMRFAAVMRLPDHALGSFDAALDLPRADELELIGTEGSLLIPDPWICRDGELQLTRKGSTERIPVDRSDLTGGEHDPYRIEMATISAAITAGQPLEFGGADIVAQATAYEALMESARRGSAVTLR